VPEVLKPRLRQVYGRLCSSLQEACSYLSSVPSTGKLVTVGDIVSYNAISAGLNPDIIVYDGLAERQKVKDWMKNFLDAYMADERMVRNPAGHITGELWQAAFESLRSSGKSRIVVNGEEDMAVVPFVILGSTGDCILYGMPGQGVDVIVVEDMVKKQFERMLEQMKGGAEEKESKEDEARRAKKQREERIKEMFKERSRKR